MLLRDRREKLAVAIRNRACDADRSVGDVLASHHHRLHLGPVRGLDASAQPAQLSVAPQRVKAAQMGEPWHENLKQPLHRGREGQRSVRYLADRGQELETARLA